MKHLTLIGMGTGNPDHISLEGRRALAEAEAILIPRKGKEKAELAQVREEICHDLLGEDAPIRYFDMPRRDPKPRDYVDEVHRWHDQICLEWQNAAKGVGHVALLVWGDPSLYDSTLRIAERLTPKPEVTVIPGVTAISALCAAHATTLNSVGGTVAITTGRKLREEGIPKECDTAIVMLDGDCTFMTLEAADYDIWWGAYLGMPQQILLHGPLADLSDEIMKTRQNAQNQHGWIMDIYLLRRK